MQKSPRGVNVKHCKYVIWTVFSTASLFGIIICESSWSGLFICTCRLCAPGGTGPADFDVWSHWGLCRAWGSSAARSSWPSRRRERRRRPAASARQVYKQRHVTSRAAIFAYRLYIWFNMCAVARTVKCFLHLPRWPLMSWPPIYLQSTWRRGRRVRSLACGGAAEQSASRRRGRTPGRAWNEPWSCWCNSGLQTGRLLRLKRDRRQQGAGGHLLTSIKIRAEENSVLYSQLSLNLIPIGNPGWSEESR